MWGLEKRAFISKAKTKTVEFDGFSLKRNEADGKGIGALYAEKSVNCDCLDGALKSGVGARALLDEAGGNVVLPLGVSAAQFFLLRDRNDDGTYSKILSFVTAEGKFYLYDKESGIFLRRGDLGEGVRLHEALDMDGEPQVLSIGPSGVYSFDEYNGWTASSVVGFDRAVCGCVFKDRVFVAAEPCTLIYSAPLEPTNFENTIDESGRLYFSAEKGKVIALQAFQNDLYVFFEYGFLRLEISGAARDFKPVFMDYNGGRIFGGSIGVCGERLFFLTAGGMKRFDGSKVETVFEALQIRPKKEEQNCAFAVFGDKFLLQFIGEDDLTRTAMLAKDGENGYYLFGATAVGGLTTIDGETYCQIGDEVLLVAEDGALPQGETYSFSAQTEFGVLGRKTLKTLLFEGEGNFSLTVESETETRTYELSMTDGRAVARIGVRGERFLLTFSLGKGAVVRKMSAEIVYLGA